MISIPVHPPAAAPPLKREPESEEDQEAKRRRRLQALAMISGKEIDYSAPPLEQIPTPNAAPQDRDDNLANIAAAISNRAIGGKLVIKSNPRAAKKPGHLHLPHPSLDLMGSCRSWIWWRGRRFE